MNRVLILASLLVTGCFQCLGGTSPASMSLDQKAQAFLQRLYPGEQFNIVCDEHSNAVNRSACAATRRSDLTLPPIAFFCFARENRETTCHLAGAER